MYIFACKTEITRHSLGNRFEYGLECVGLDKEAYEDDYDSNSSEAEYDEYSDYVFKYSDSEIREIIGEYLLNGNMEDSLVRLMIFMFFCVDLVMTFEL